MPHELELPEQHTHADSGPAWEAAAVAVSLNGQDFHSAPAAAPLHYKYYPHPTLTALEPTGGPAEAEGRVLLVHGSGFSALDAHRDASALACKFGAHDAQPAAWYNDTLVHCAVPTGGASVGPATGLGAGEHLVQISLNGVDWPSARRTEVGRGGRRRARRRGSTPRAATLRAARPGTSPSRASCASPCTCGRPWSPSRRPSASRRAARAWS